MLNYYHNTSLNNYFNNQHETPAHLGKLKMAKLYDENLSYPQLAIRVNNGHVLLLNSSQVDWVMPSEFSTLAAVILTLNRLTKEME